MRRWGWPTPTGTHCPPFAAIAAAGIKLHIVADHGDTLHRIRPVADQHRPLDRRAHFAVFDHIGLGAAEHELARCDIHLAAAEGNGINALPFFEAMISSGVLSPDSI